MPGPIARIWSGRVPRVRGDAYLELMERRALADYRAVPGNRWAIVLRRDDDPVTEVTTVSAWDSLDAVRAFAGDPVDRARYYDFDREYLLDFPDTVTHHRLYSGATDGREP